MLILAFDTSLAACSAAVADAAAGRVLASQYRLMERGHAEALAPMLRDVMAEAGIAFHDLRRVAVTNGPGSFTGVRIGLAMARSLRLALGIPAVAIDTLRAIALNQGEGEPVAVASDARRDEIYLGLPSMPPRIVSLAGAAAQLPMGPLRIAGTGADALIAATGRHDLARSSSGDLPAAANFALAAASLDPPSTPPEPIYLRAPDAKPQPQPLRPALASEAAVLAAIHAESFDEPWSAAEIAKLMAMPGALALLAQEGGEPAGFVLVRRAADEAEILTIATRPHARRRGIASRLIAAAAASLGGIEHLFIEVASANEAANRLYHKLGFHPAGRRKDYYRRADGRSDDAVIMRKDIAA